MKGRTLDHRHRRAVRTVNHRDRNIEVMTAQELVDARSALNMSQSDLARALGKHPQSISRYERGGSPISPVMAMAVRSLKPLEPVEENADA